MLLGLDLRSVHRAEDHGGEGFPPGFTVLRKPSLGGYGLPDIAAPVRENQGVQVARAGVVFFVGHQQVGLEAEDRWKGRRAIVGRGAIRVNQTQVPHQGNRMKI